MQSRSKSKIVKFDEEGKYCPFPGITVVSAIKDQDLDFARELYDILDKCEITKKYYSWLPFDSYHMTTLNLYTMSKVGESEWDKFMIENMTKFREMSDLLEKNEFSPDIELEELEVSGVVVFNLKLSAEQQAIVYSVAERLGHKDKFSEWFHITLGYCYKQPSEDIKQAINDELKPLFSYLGKKLQLDPPKLCYFNDMLKFIPWRGEENPFLK